MEFIPIVGMPTSRRVPLVASGTGRKSPHNNNYHPMKTDTNTLIDALRILARDIHSEDGIANTAITEAADRLEKLQRKVRNQRRELKELKGRK